MAVPTFFLDVHGAGRGRERGDMSVCPANLDYPTYLKKDSKVGDPSGLQCRLMGPNPQHFYSRKLNHTGLSRAAGQEKSLSPEGPCPT
jgi:hypothetical protein